MDLVFRCATCDQTLVAAHTQAARYTRCPSCGAPARVPGPPAWRVDPVASGGPCPSCGTALSSVARKCGRCGEIVDGAFVARKAALGGLEGVRAEQGDVGVSTPPSGAGLAYLSLALACVPCTSFVAIFVARVARHRIARGGAGREGIAVMALAIAFAWCTVILLAAIGAISSMP